MGHVAWFKMNEWMNDHAAGPVPLRSTRGPFGLGSLPFFSPLSASLISPSIRHPSLPHQFAKRNKCGVFKDPVCRAWVLAFFGEITLSIIQKLKGQTKKVRGIFCWKTWGFDISGPVGFAHTRYTAVTATENGSLLHLTRLILGRFSHAVFVLLILQPVCVFTYVFHKLTVHLLLSITLGWCLCSL